METRYDYDITKIEGPDADIETSLKEYGIAWIEGPDNTVMFYYGIGRDGEEYVRFDGCSFPADMDIRKEFDWCEFGRVSDFIGSDIFEGSFIQQIQDLVAYCGCEEIFGSSYWEGFTYEEIFHIEYKEREE